MASLPHDHVTPFQESDKSKKEQVADMFDQIAGKYDFMNRFLSVRTDVQWRKKAIKFIGTFHPNRILDVATGTGDMAIRAGHTLTQVTRIDGIDISAQMLEVGKQKVQKEGLEKKVHLQLGDSETINFPDNTFDAVMVAFGIRNFEHLEKGLAEINRVLKPGGVFVVLEFSRPQQPVKGLYNFYMGKVAPAIARLFKQNKEAYQYLNVSANAFPDRGDLLTIFKQVGFTDNAYKSLSLGICCMYTAKKAASI